MSLINQVLLDLEKRHASESELKPLPPYVRAVPAPSRSGVRTIVVALGGVLVIVALAVFVFLYRSDFAPFAPSPQSVAVPLAVKPVEPIPTPVEQAPVAAASAEVAPAEVAPAQAAYTPVSRLSDQLSLVPLPPIRVEQPVAPERSIARGDKVPAKPGAAQIARKASRDEQPTRTSSTAAGLPGADSSTSTAPPVPQASASTDTNQTAIKGPETVLNAPASQSEALPKVEVPDRVEVPVRVETPARLETANQPDMSVSTPPGVPPPTPKADAPGAIDKQMREVVPAERAEIAFRRGVAQLQEGRANAAEIEFRNALKLDPTHGAAFQAMLGLLLDTGRNGEAEQQLRQALDRNPRQPRYAMVLARLEIERGEISTAVNTMVGVLPYVQSDPDFYAFLAALLQREGRHREAVDYYRTALRTLPGNGVWMMGLGISLRASNQVAEARDAFQRALASKQLSSELQEFVERQLREMTAQKRK